MTEHGLRCARQVSVIVVLCLALLAGAVWIVRSRFGPAAVHVKGSEAFVRQAVRDVTAFAPTPAWDTRALEVAVSTSAEGTCAEAKGYVGFVCLSEKEWVYFHSTSTDFSDDADVVIAIDQSGSMYACNAHVCPTLVLYWPPAHALGPKPTLRDFWSARMLDTRKGTDRWISVDAWKTAPP